MHYPKKVCAMWFCNRTNDDQNSILVVHCDSDGPMVTHVPHEHTDKWLFISISMVFISAIISSLLISALENKSPRFGESEKMYRNANLTSHFSIDLVIWTKLCVSGIYSSVRLKVCRLSFLKIFCAAVRPLHRFASQWSANEQKATYFSVYLFASENCLRICFHGFAAAGHRFRSTIGQKTFFPISRQ